VRITVAASPAVAVDEIHPALTELDIEVRRIDPRVGWEPGTPLDHVVVLDARHDLDETRAQAWRLARAATSIALLPVITNASIDQLAAGWPIGDFILDTASVTEAGLRLARAQRRHEHHPGAVAFQLDEHELALRAGGRRVSLTPSEFVLLSVLAAQPHRVLSRTDLISLAWPGTDEPPLATTVDVYIARIRRKLGPGLDLIRTVRNVGYQLVRAF
jgi:DNA-binding response OmpR family regulator